jgi:hypothetical protein
MAAMSHDALHTIAPYTIYTMWAPAAHQHDQPSSSQAQATATAQPIWSVTPDGGMGRVCVCGEGVPSLRSALLEHQVSGMAQCARACASCVPCVLPAACRLPVCVGRVLCCRVRIILGYIAIGRLGRRQ